MRLTPRPLALRAKIAAPVSHPDALNLCAAAGAVLANLVGDLELEVSGALLAAGAKIGVGAGPFIFDGG